MESLYNIPYLLLECPNLKIKKPSWVKQPSAMTVFALVLLSYFLVTGGKGKDAVFANCSVAIYQPHMISLRSSIE